MTPPHVQSAWEFKEERVRVAELAASCTRLSKKKVYLVIIKIKEEEEEEEERNGKN